MEKKSLRFEEWQRDNPGKKFRDFFADNLELKIQRDRKHNSLGRELKTGEFGEAGARFFRNITDYGLGPDDVCVDYGCGTLRLGYHAMNQLKPGRYWGFEIADFLLAEGRNLIGEKMYTEKRPNLRVISPETVAEAAAAKPQLLFSVRVLKSVHPDEVDEYFGNIITIIGTTGKAVIQAHWSDEETFQYGKRKWGHGMPLIRKFLADRGYKLVIRKAVDLKEGDRILKHGMFAVAHESVELPLFSKAQDDRILAADLDEAD